MIRAYLQNLEGYGYTNTFENIEAVYEFCGKYRYEIMETYEEEEA